MTTRTKTSRTKPAPSTPSFTISNCTISAEGGISENTRITIVALAEAVKANGEALAEIAKALGAAASTPVTGISINVPKAES